MLQAVVPSLPRHHLTEWRSCSSPTTNFTHVMVGGRSYSYHISFYCIVLIPYAHYVPWSFCVYLFQESFQQESSYSRGKGHEVCSKAIVLRWSESFLMQQYSMPVMSITKWWVLCNVIKGSFLGGGGGVVLYPNKWYRKMHSAHTHINPCMKIKLAIYNYRHHRLQYSLIKLFWMVLS